jgi:hypothetical protein
MPGLEPQHSSLLVSGQVAVFSSQSLPRQQQSIRPEHQRDNRSQLSPVKSKYSECRLATARSLHRNGMDIIRVSLSRPFVIAISKIQTACLMQSKSGRKSKGRSDYYTRSLIGTAGELAFHMFAKLVGLKPRLLLPSLTAQGVDHLIAIGPRELRVQSKTLCPADGTNMNSIAGHYRLPVDMHDEGIDWYSWAIVSAEELAGASAHVTVDLFAFAPMSFVKETAELNRRFGLSVKFEHLRSEKCRRLSHQLLDQDDRLPAELTMSERSYGRLTSAILDDWLLEALDLVASPSDASRVLDMLTTKSGLLQTLRATDPPHDRVPNIKDVADNEAEGCATLNVAT